MFRSLQIIVFGTQPTAKISDKKLSKLIKREFDAQADEVKYKLQQLRSDSHADKNRLSAAILRLANGNIKAVDHYIHLSNTDSRDVILQGEYPRCFQFGMGEITRKEKKRIFLEDWKQYSKWLRGKHMNQTKTGDHD